MLVLICKIMNLPQYFTNNLSVSTGMQHQEVARLIAESFARRERHEIEFLVVEAKKSNLEPKPTALIFLEA